MAVRLSESQLAPVYERVGEYRRHGVPAHTSFDGPTDGATKLETPKLVVYTGTRDELASFEREYKHTGVLDEVDVTGVHGLGDLLDMYGAPLLDVTLLSVIRDVEACDHPVMADAGFRQFLNDVKHPCLELWDDAALRSARDKIRQDEVSRRDAAAATRAQAPRPPPAPAFEPPPDARWTPALQKALEKAYSEDMKASRGERASDWARIAADTPGTTAQQCAERVKVCRAAARAWREQKSRAVEEERWRDACMSCGGEVRPGAVDRLCGGTCFMMKTHILSEWEKRREGGMYSARDRMWPYRLGLVKRAK